MKTLLLTGGCGFIGSNFVHYLPDAKPSLTVLNFDCLTYGGNLDNLSSIAHDSRDALSRATSSMRPQWVQRWTKAWLRLSISPVVGTNESIHVKARVLAATQASGDDAQ